MYQERSFSRTVFDACTVLVMVRPVRTIYFDVSE